MKLLSSFYSNDESLHAEVYRVDEHTFVVLTHSEEDKTGRVYFNTLQDAEDCAEDFVI